MALIVDGDRVIDWGLAAPTAGTAQPVQKNKAIPKPVRRGRRKVVSATQAPATCPICGQDPGPHWECEVCGSV